MANSLTKIKTNAIDDDAVTLAKQAAGTDGQIITYDASGNPTAVGPGTDGQVLTSTGAGSPPAFETLPASGPSLANDANNRVITGTGSGLNGEANLTFDGGALSQTIDANDEGINITAAGNHSARFKIDSNQSGADDTIFHLSGRWNSTEVASIHYRAGADTTNKDDGRLTFHTTPSGGSLTERLRITEDGKIGIGTTSPTATAISSNTVNGVLHIDSSGADSASVLKLGGKDGSSNSNYAQIGWAGANNRLDFTVNGNQALRVEADKDVTVVDGDLIIGTSGHGIDFSATGNESGMSSELLDSYEEGTFTPTLSNGPSISSESGRYIRIGKVVHVFWAFTAASDGPSGHCNMNMPFTLTSTAPACGGTAWDYRTKEVFAHVSAGTSKLYFYDVDASWLAGSSALIEGEVFRGCTTYEVA